MSSPPRGARRPDESMSLLVDITTNALDPAYAEAAARHQGQSRAAPRRVLLTLGLGGVIAAAMVAAGVAQAHIRAPAAAASRGQLLHQVQQETRSVNALERQLSALRSTTTALQERELASTLAGERLTRELSAAELAAGTVAVTGPGVRVTLNDGSNQAGSPNRVLDTDLQSAVNALWASGAEAIAVNGQRLAAESAIRGAGEAIVVNFQPVSPPYVIDAIGDPAAVELGFATSPAAARLRALSQLYGIAFHTSRATVLRLPAAPDLSLREARP